jgi:20S proteasome alpha/beta subunit
MVSDGRYVEEPITGEKPHILKNDLPKVRKINRNVVVGFAGDTLAAVQIINAVDEYQTQYLTLEKVVKILREKAATVSVQPVGVRLIVGGRNRKGVFTMTMMGSVDGYEPQTQAARKGAYLIEGACSHTDVAPWLEEEVKPQAANWHSLDDVAHTLDGCIAKMAKLDKSINTTYFRQLVM